MKHISIEVEIKKIKHFFILLNKVNSNKQQNYQLDIFYSSAITSLHILYGTLIQGFHSDLIFDGKKGSFLNFSLGCRYLR